MKYVTLTAKTADRIHAMCAKIQELVSVNETTAARPGRKPGRKPKAAPAASAALPPSLAGK